MVILAFWNAIRIKQGVIRKTLNRNYSHAAAKDVSLYNALLSRYQFDCTLFKDYVAELNSLLSSAESEKMIVTIGGRRRMRRRRRRRRRIRSEMRRRRGRRRRRRRRRRGGEVGEFRNLHQSDN
ncbi:hypothetical protein MTR_1g055390 [Medicago truncatula]|uniref:Uncharacterized protein n=1 Tax=Medicago truncatula TaxID=3880 RepID=A0A072VJV8_MEDTR|nr:hypothetical protein MTR_1g055390 [Medicago truncatula]